MTAATDGSRGAAIVTGAGGGLGRAACSALARAGYDVVLVGRSRQRLLSTAASIEGHRALVLPLDVRSEADMARMATRTCERFGRIDALVTCAGIARVQGAGLLPRTVARLPPSDWAAILETNLTGVFLSNRAVLSAMRAQRAGQILNVVSARAGREGQSYAAAYSASKTGVVGFSGALSAESAPLGIRVQLLFPEAIDTPMLDRARIAGPRLHADDVARVIVDMLSLPADCRHERAVLHGLPGQRESHEDRITA